ncbi:type III-A CRISPR-associated protein Csm2 [bacterium]|nr:type III-A CRISPR-associated protein Csm2 [bacterium]
MPFLQPQEVQGILNGDAQLLVNKAKQVGQQLVQGGVSSSQMRNIFGTVKKLQMQATVGQFDQNVQYELKLLIPKIYYAAKRAGKRQLNDFRDDIEKLINNINNSEEKFLRFCDYIEAVLAYHKAFGGR